MQQPNAHGDESYQAPSGGSTRCAGLGTPKRLLAQDAYLVTGRCKLVLGRCNTSARTTGLTDRL